MTTQKKEFSAVDASPAVLYAKKDADSQFAYPVIISDSGQLVVAAGLIPGTYDFIAVSYSGTNITNVYYKTGGASGTLVATLALTYSGTSITSVTRT